MNTLSQTPMLDFTNARLQDLIREREWIQKDDKTKIKEIYNYVRDEIKFGYNKDDAMKASQVIGDGYGQCNTKGIVLMALLRGVGIPCRIHGFMIDKKMQKGAITGFAYARAPLEIVHSWVEVEYRGVWYNLEGFILDKPYLNQLQRKFKNQQSFQGYGVAIDNFQNPPIEWDENDTYIQKNGITKDLGIYEDPDALFAIHSQQMSALETLMYQKVIRHWMNRTIRKIRRG